MSLYVIEKYERYNKLQQKVQAILVIIDTIKKKKASAKILILYTLII